eukprot:scaffold107247_cov26-Tisochrysis_lutea.AAC.2
MNERLGQSPLLPLPYACFRCLLRRQARGGLERTFRDHRKDPWSTRLLVLTESHLVYYKQVCMSLASLADGRLASHLFSTAASRLLLRASSCLLLRALRCIQ